MCTEHSCTLLSPSGMWRWLVRPDSASSSRRRRSCRLQSRVRLRVELGGGGGGVACTLMTVVLEMFGVGLGGVGFGGSGFATSPSVTVGGEHEKNVNVEWGMQWTVNLGTS